MNKTIGIMGCGWLGKPLAESLLEKGHVIKGTTTSIAKLDDLGKAGIDAYMVNLQETYIDGGIEKFLENLDVLVVNIPPGLRANPQSDYRGRIQLLLRVVKEHSAISQLIYVSSTSVFQDTADFPYYTEASPANATDIKGRQLIAAEKEISNNFKNTTIIRPGGLIGCDRHPITYLAGKKNISNPDAPVNLTNREFLIDAIEKVIDRTIQSPIVHAISEDHESRKSYYTNEARHRSLELPDFETSPGVGKYIISTIL